MKPCINSTVKQFCNNFISLRMDLSNNNGPTVEFTILKDKGWKVDPGNNDAINWIANNLNIDINNWVKVFEKEEKSSSGNFITQRYIDDHWLFVNKEHVGIEFYDGYIRKIQENGSLFVTGAEYFSINGISAGNGTTRSPQSFTIKKSLLSGWYSLLNSGEYYISTSGSIVQKDRNMDAKQFIAEYNPTVPNPEVEFGDIYYGNGNLITAITNKLNLKELKQVNISDTFKVRGLFNDTGSLWDIIQLHSHMSKRIPIGNSIWGIGSIDDISDSEWNENIPDSSVDSSVEEDFMAGEGKNIMQISKTPGRYPAPQDLSDPNNSTNRDTRTPSGGSSFITRAGSDGDISKTYLEKMYGVGSFENFSTWYFAFSLLSQTQIFSTALQIIKCIYPSNRIFSMQEFLKMKEMLYLFPEIEKIVDGDSKWEGFLLKEDTDLSTGFEPGSGQNLGEMVKETFNEIKGPTDFGPDGTDIYNGLFPNGFGSANNRLQDVINYYAEYSRFYIGWRFQGKDLIPGGSYDADRNGESVGGIMAINHFGSQRYNLGTKNWYVRDSSASVNFIDGQTNFEDTPFWRFQSNTSNPSDFEREKEARGHGQTLADYFGLNPQTSSPALNGGYEHQHLLCVDVGGESVPSFEDVTKQFDDKNYLKLNQLSNTEYHETTNFDIKGAGAYNKEIWDDIGTLLYAFKGWADFQVSNKPSKIKVAFHGMKETDISKVNMDGALEEDTDKENQKETVNPITRNKRSIGYKSIFSCDHPINVKYDTFHIGYNYKSDDTNTVIAEEGSLQNLDLMAYSSYCPPSSIKRKSFSLVNEIYSLSDTDIKALEGLNFSVQGGTLKAQYSFSNAQIIPDFNSLVGAKFAFNKIVKG